MDMIKKRVLTNKEVKEAKDILEIYNKVYSCKICGIIYGTDFEEDTGFCHKCEEKFNRKRGEKR